MKPLSPTEVYQVIQGVAYGATVYKTAEVLGFDMIKLETSLNDVELRRVLIQVAEMAYNKRKDA